MCDFGIILGLASAGIGAIGSIQQANAAAAAANYNAQVQEMNAQISEENAEDALERGADEEQALRRRHAQIIGQQEAAMAANGVDLSFGSPLDTLVDTTYLADLDALNVRSNAARENYNYRVQAANQRAGAELFRMEARSARTGGFLNAAGSVLTGASNAAKRASTIGLIN